MRLKNTVTGHVLAGLWHSSLSINTFFPPSACAGADGPVINRFSKSSPRFGYDCVASMGTFYCPSHRIATYMLTHIACAKLGFWWKYFDNKIEYLKSLRLNHKTLMARVLVIYMAACVHRQYFS